MSRSKLRELDVLEMQLAKECYLIDWSKKDSYGTISLNSQTDRCPLVKAVQHNPMSKLAAVTLDETKNLEIDASFLNQITITELDVETLVLKLDHFAVQHYKSKTWNKACDYLILTEFNDEKFAIFIDLKTSISEDPSDKGRLVFKGLQYDSDIVWQMLGADLLFNGLVNATYLKEKYFIQRTSCRRTYSQNMNKCKTSSLAKYNRCYLVLYLKTKQRTSTTNGGIKATVGGEPNDACLEREVLALRVKDKECLPIGDIISFIRQ